MVNDELSKLSSAAISLTIIFVIIAIGTIVIVGVGDTTKNSFVESGTAINLNATNGTTLSLGTTDVTGVNTILRANDSLSLGSGNFTVNGVGGTVTFAYDGNASEGTFFDFSDKLVNVTFTAFEKGPWYNATLVDGTAAMLNISKFNPTIAVIVVSAIIIMIVVGAFVFFRRE